MSDGPHVLWFRQDRSRPWEAVFGPASYPECVGAIVDGLGRHHGDWYVRAGTGRPTNKNLTAPRRAK